MTVDIPITIACGDYDRTRAIKDGRVPVEGCAVTYIPLEPEEVFFRAFRYQEFDVCELSLVGYLVARDQGKAFTAIPVFPHRRFRHGFVWKRTGCGVERPADLNGRRVGLDTLQNSAGLWMRGILADHYGVDLRSIEWWCQEEEDVAFEPAAWMKVRRVAKGGSIDRMLVEGQLEAAIYPETLPSFRDGSPKVGLLFPNPKAAEIDYYKKSGIFPIMHTVVVKNAILERNPWVAMSVVQAFEKAKQLCYERMRDPRNLQLAWVREAMDEQQAVLGKDAWPYGLVEPNRKALEAVVRTMFDQGMIRKKPEVEELFFAPSLQEIQHYL